MFEVNTLL